MRSYSIFVGAGLMVIFIAIAIGISIFFGIINADAFLHPQTAYKRVRLVVVGDHDPIAQPIIVHWEAGCKDDTPLKVVWSLRHQPDHWVPSEDELTNEPIVIWTGNEEYGLTINQAWTYSDKCKDLLYTTVRQWQKNTTDKAATSLTQ